MVANAGVCLSDSIVDGAYLVVYLVVLITSSSNSTKVTVEQWGKLFAVNVRGVLLSVARLMIEQILSGCSRMIRLSHRSLLNCWKERWQNDSYSASKFAVRPLTRSAGMITILPTRLEICSLCLCSVACECGVHGIRVNVS